LSYERECRNSLRHPASSPCRADKVRYGDHRAAADTDVTRARC